MFKIVNGAGQVLPLPKGFTITLEKFDPLFNSSDAFFQDMSYPGTVPLTPEVMKFIGHAHLDEMPPSTYSLPVQADGQGLSFAGIFNCAIRGQNLEFDLQLNYAAVNSLVEGIKVTDIRSGDGMVLASEAAYKALMMDAMLHPDKYPFTFFPVNNPGQSQVATPPNPFFRPWINYFNSATGEFELDSAVLPGTTAHSNGQQPYYKLVHVIKELLIYLGFTPAGDFFSEPRFQNLYIYTRYSTLVFTIFQSMKYMPNMLISDLLKKIRDRFHLSIFFNTATGTATVRSFSAIKNDPEAFDLTPYLAAYAEQDVPEKSGFTVTLKSDEHDEAFKAQQADAEGYPPLYTLTAGNGANEIALDVATLKTEDLSTPGNVGKRYVATNQSVFNNYNWGFKLPPDLSDGYAFYAEPSEVNDWPLRVIRYLGYKNLSDGGHWPASEAVELDEYDAEWYRFLNDSKQHKLTLHIPAAIFGQLDYTQKFVYRSADQNYIEIKLEKDAEDIIVDQDIVKVQYTARSLLYDIKTPVTIQAIKPAEEPGMYQFGLIKAYFDPAIHGFEQVTIDIQGRDANAGVVYNVPVITNPTNARGAGGVAVVAEYLSGGDFTDVGKVQIRIHQGRPKYIELYGVKHNFIWNGSYSYVDVGFLMDIYLKQIRDTYWIVF